MRNIAVLTSGGDAPGMNAAIRAVVRTGINLGMNVFGIERGFEGLIDGNISLIPTSDAGDILHRGGTVLKTSRSSRFMTNDGFKMALTMLDSFDIEGLVIIGGDGSLHGGKRLSENGVKVMGVPGTIDNDLGFTDYTIGFDTAVNTVTSAINNIRDTSTSHDRTTIIEVMGRKCGDIALYSAIAGGAESVLIPEVPTDIKEICKKIVQGRNRGKKHNIIIKAEGVDITTEDLVREIMEKTGQEAKPVVLAYLQRGGSPTAKDRILASMMGERAAKLLYSDSESKAIGIVNDEIVALDLEDALKTENIVELNMIELSEMLSR